MQKNWTISEIKKILLNSKDYTEEEEEQDAEEGHPKGICGVTRVNFEGRGQAVIKSVEQTRGVKRKKSSLNTKRLETRKRRATRRFEIVKLLDRRWNQSKVHWILKLS